MEAVVVLVPVVLVVVLILLGSRRSSVVTVNDDMILASLPNEVERRAFGALGSVPGATMGQVFPGQLTLTSKWTPSWVVVVAILSFPLGLLLLLLVRQDLVLHVRFTESTEGTLAQVAGKSRRKVAIAVGEVFNQMSYAASAG